MLCDVAGTDLRRAALSKNKDGPKPPAGAATIAACSILGNRKQLATG